MPPADAPRPTTWSDEEVEQLRIMATEEVKRCTNIRELTIAPLLAEAMRRISEESSVSSLFD